ncbi:MAG: plasmid mobilization protein [Mycobacteriales bacterium]
MTPFAERSSAGRASLSEAQLAEQYSTNGIDPAEWASPQALTPSARRQITLSVRFSEEEITAIRKAAQRAGVKPTALIRTRALATGVENSTQPPNTIDAAIDVLARDLDRLRHAAHAV